MATRNSTEPVVVVVSKSIVVRPGSTCSGGCVLVSGCSVCVGGCSVCVGVTRCSMLAFFLFLIYASTFLEFHILEHVNYDWQTIQPQICIIVSSDKVVSGCLLFTYCPFNRK